MPNFKLKQTSEQVQKAIDNSLNPDKTLNEEGVPADAKAVGDALKNAGKVKSVNGKIGDVETPKAFYIVVTDSGNGKYAIDKTADEIKAAYNDKYTLFAKLNDLIMPLRSVTVNQTPIGDEWEVIFEAEEKTTQGFVHSFKSTRIRLYGMSTFSVDFSETDRKMITQAGAMNMFSQVGHVHDASEITGLPAASDTPNSVKQYGAKGDGTTDDTAAFKEALAAERVVYVPGGTYKLSDTITIGANSCLELSQDTVLNFTQTDKPCISTLRLAHLKGNHATIFVPYTFNSIVLNCDNGDDYDRLDPDDTANSNNVAVPPFKKWDPQWKMSRYVTDINICKPDSRGEHCSSDGACYGTAIYIHNDVADYPVSYMWGVSMSGVRIAGGFNYGIRIYNIGDTEDCWNHDMRIEALIHACKIGVSVENCRYARLAVTIQPRTALNGTKYAQHGIELIDSRGVDLSSSRVWDWNANKTLWADGNRYQHISLVGECMGLILDDYLYYSQASSDIRDLIYTDKASNLEKMTILQEPITRWFKTINGVPYYYDGNEEKKLTTQEELDKHFDTDIVKNFTDVLASATDTDGTIYNGVGYKKGYRLNGGDGTVITSPDTTYTLTGFMPLAVGQKMYINGMSLAECDDTCRFCLYDSDKNFIVAVAGTLLKQGNNWSIAYAETENGFWISVNSVSATKGTAYIRFNVFTRMVGDRPMISVDEPIEYTVEGFLANGIKVKGENIVGLPGSAFDGFYYVEGTGTTAGVWTGTCDGITEYYDGLTVLYKLNVDGASTTTLNINNLGAVGVKRNATTSVSTNYPVGSVVMLTYSGGAWLTADYDANTKTTAGTSQKSGTKMFLVGATSQTSSGTTTYTNSNVYIGDDDNLYSGGKKVANDEDVVKTINGKTPDEKGNVEVQTDGGTSIDVTAEVGQTIIVKNVDENGKPTEYEAADFPVVDGAGEMFLSYTATFATDAAAQSGVRVADSMTNLLDWLDVNGELFKVHREQSGMSSIWCDEDGNKWVSSSLGGVYVYAKTAGTYTYTMYAPADTPMFDPQYLPPNLAKKADIPKSGGGTGGTSIDVTAEVGQTIVVKEVDANGKPTKWESADYQPRTHWMNGMTEVDIIPPTTFTPTYNSQFGATLYYNLPAFELEEGKTYTVIFDGTTYTCTAIAVAVVTFSGIGIGNPIFAGGENNGMPFGISMLNNGDLRLFMGMDTNEHTVRIIEAQPMYNKIPEEYISKADFAVELSETDNGYTLLTPWEDIISATRAGKNIYGVISATNMETDQYGNFRGFTNHAKYFTCMKMDYSVTTPKCEMELFTFTNTYVAILSITRDENGVTTVTSSAD